VAIPTLHDSLAGSATGMLVAGIAVFAFGVLVVVLGAGYRGRRSS
jgi:hypothetical protein